MNPIGSAAARLAVPSVLLLSCVALAGCGGLGRALGMGKASPDEFAIVTKAPLVIPPDYSLKPPAPGERSDDEDTGLAAQQALIGDADIFTPDMSGGERALVAAAGAQYSDPLIRQVINQEYAGLMDKNPDLTERLVFWDSPVQTVNAEINPGAEAGRIATEGNPPKTTQRAPEETAPAPAPSRVPGTTPAVPDRVEGQAPPTIGKRKGMLDGIL